MEKLADLNEKFINFVRTNLDLLIAGGDDEFPVMGSVIVKSGIATRKQLDILEEQGHIKSVTIEVPSILVPSKTVPEKAYYTERKVPKLVEETIPKKSSIEIIRN